jgi:hypothetical protein
MRALALAALLCALAPALARAEAGNSGFNPRFSASSAYPDQPDYRPPDRPRHQFEFMIDVNGDREEDLGEAGEGPRPDRPHHYPQHPRHRR